eukprot:2304903-Prymnesium_polylepis.2
MMHAHTHTHRPGDSRVKSSQARGYVPACPDGVPRLPACPVVSIHFRKFPRGAEAMASPRRSAPCFSSPPLLCAIGACGL